MHAPNLVPDPGLVAHPRACLFAVRVTTEHAGNPAGHVWNVEYVRWIDHVAERHAALLGWTRDRLIELGALWFVARHEIDYHDEARVGDDLVIATWVRSQRRVRSWRETVIYRAVDGRLICRAVTMWALVDLGTRRPTQIPDEMARSFEPLADETS